MSWCGSACRIVWAKRQFTQRLGTGSSGFWDSGFDLGTNGKISFGRDEIHERR